MSSLDPTPLDPRIPRPIDLPEEVLSVVIKHLYNPLPPPWQANVAPSQHGLAMCMRVSSAFNRLAAPVLYRDVVLFDYPSLAFGINEAAYGARSIVDVETGKKGGEGALQGIGADTAGAGDMDAVAADATGMAKDTDGAREAEKETKESMQTVIAGSPTPPRLALIEPTIGDAPRKSLTKTQCLAYTQRLFLQEPEHVLLSRYAGSESSAIPSKDYPDEPEWHIDARDALFSLQTPLTVTGPLGPHAQYMIIGAYVNHSPYGPLPVHSHYARLLVEEFALLLQKTQWKVCQGSKTRTFLNSPTNRFIRVIPCYQWTTHFESDKQIEQDQHIYGSTLWISSTAMRMKCAACWRSFDTYIRRAHGRYLGSWNGQLPKPFPLRIGYPRDPDTSRHCVHRIPEHVFTRYRCDLDPVSRICQTDHFCPIDASGMTKEQWKSALQDGLDKYIPREIVRPMRLRDSMKVVVDLCESVCPGCGDEP